MSEPETKADLQHYHQLARDALLWKLDGVAEYDARRPVVPTGTNLLGLMKHVASVEAGYLGEVFGRPFPELLPWLDDDAELNADMWATAAETRDQIVGLYHRVWAYSDATAHALSLDAEGTVPWWPPERRRASLQVIVVHMIAETNRHAGHADLVRELINGAAGLREDNSNLPDADNNWWLDYCQRLERVAAEVGGR